MPCSYDVKQMAEKPKEGPVAQNMERFHWATQLLSGRAGADPGPLAPWFVIFPHRATAQRSRDNSKTEDRAVPTSRGGRERRNWKGSHTPRPGPTVPAAWVEARAHGGSCVQPGKSSWDQSTARLCSCTIRSKHHCTEVKGVPPKYRLRS